MKDLKNYINEAAGGQVWVAIQDDYTPNSYDS